MAIVGLRVEVLKLGSGVGSQIQQANLLQSSNSALRTQISALSDNRRIETLAEGYGMHMPSPLDVHFVKARVGTHVQAAIRNIATPSGSTFLSGLASEQQTHHLSTQTIAVLNGSATSATSNSATSNVTSAQPQTGGTGASASLTGTTAAGQTSSNAGTTTGQVVTGGTSASSSSSTSSGATSGTSNVSATGAGTSSGLNTGVTNTVSASGSSQGAGTPATTTGGTGLSG